MLDTAFHRSRAAERVIHLIRGDGMVMEKAAPRHVHEVYKASIAGGTTGSHDALVDWRNESAALVAPSMHAGLFDVIRNNAVPGAFFTQYGTALTYPTAAAGTEGAAIPVTKFEAGRRELRARQASAIMIFSRELMRRSDAQGVVERMLPRALGLTTDAMFIPEFVAGAASIITSGLTAGTADDIAYDLQRALEAISYGSDAIFHMGMGVACARRVSFMRNLDDQPVFPAMTPTGGRMANITVTVTEALTDDVIVIDATGIIAASGDVTFKVAQGAAIEMSTTPTNASRDASSPPAPVETETVSMFQTGSVALKADREFDWTALRSAYGCRIQGAGALWGAAATSPPAWSPPS